jgi:hypothetical protein
MIKLSLIGSGQATANGTRRVQRSACPTSAGPFESRDPGNGETIPAHDPGTRSRGQSRSRRSRGQDIGLFYGEDADLGDRTPTPDRCLNDSCGEKGRIPDVPLCSCQHPKKSTFPESVSHKGLCPRGLCPRGHVRSYGVLRLVGALDMRSAGSSGKVRQNKTKET